MRCIDVPDAPRRQCPGCFRTLAVNGNNFHADALCADGFTRKCADCRNAAERLRYRLEAPERARRVRERRAERRAYFESTGRYEAA
ncbi:hypothetical protein [Streptomyces sp. CB01580]|uniref:hypothetical protein n=1 Tax=Streptomyces sp. CB01580 TaxID=1703933 RepID=UPI00093B0C10|nr:hypothetical protein [Streptomyces sp. CB01580]OKJ42682.1 hypothetical protein AMK22_07600 [Streptomyces sp. CB01580]